MIETGAYLRGTGPAPRCEDAYAKWACPSIEEGMRVPASRMYRRAAMVVAGAAVVAGAVLLSAPVRAPVATVIGSEVRAGDIACGNAFTASPLTSVGPGSFRRMVDRVCSGAKAPYQIGGGTLAGAGALGLTVLVTVTIREGRRRVESAA